MHHLFLRFSRLIVFGGDVDDRYGECTDVCMCGWRDDLDGVNL